MLNDACCFKRVIIAAGYTDLRSGIDKLAAIIKFQYNLEPRDRNTLFLFCGRRPDRIKGLVWEGDGWLLLYKRVEIGQFSWPRSGSDMHELSNEQFHSLMQGLQVVSKHPIRDAGDLPFVM